MFAHSLAGDRASNSGLREARSGLSGSVMWSVAVVRVNVRPVSVRAR